MTWGSRSRGRGGGSRRVSRPIGWLLWLVALLVIFVVLSLLFGGLQKGSKNTGAPRPAPWRTELQGGLARGS